MRTPYPWLKPAVTLGAFVPLGVIAWRGVHGDLGADPIAEILNNLGLVALVLLVASLACTPARALAGWAWPIRIRRLLGLLAFAYACLHVVTYAAVDQEGNVRAIVADVLKRRFIFVGAATFLLLVPLALTSTAGWVRRLGFRRWKRLHRLAYVAGGLGIVHFVWRVKADLAEPLVYGLVVLVLLAARLVPERRTKRDFQVA